jgi:ATP-dependent Lhr-like helicase
MAAGELALYVERGGHTALAFGQGDRLGQAAQALAEAVKDGRVAGLRLTKVDGIDALVAHQNLQPLAEALIGAGFAVTPQGLRLRPGR